VLTQFGEYLNIASNAHCLLEALYVFIPVEMTFLLGQGQEYLVVLSVNEFVLPLEVLDAVATPCLVFLEDGLDIVSIGPDAGLLLLVLLRVPVCVQPQICELQFVVNIDNPAKQPFVLVVNPFLLVPRRCHL